MQSSGSGRLHDELTTAMDMKDAVSGKDVYSHHIQAGEGGVDAYAVNQDLDQEFIAPRPSLDKLERLVSIKDCIKSHGAPVEEQLWQGQMDSAIAKADA